MAKAGAESDVAQRLLHRRGETCLSVPFWSGVSGDDRRRFVAIELDSGDRIPAGGALLDGRVGVRSRLVLRLLGH